MGWAVGLIGLFYIMISICGFGARVILGSAGETAAGKGGNLAAPDLAQAIGGGVGSTGGDIFLAVISAVAFATILAVVAGLVISASGAVAHDIWTNVVRRGGGTEREEVRVARVGTLVIGVVAIIIAIVAGPGFNIQLLVSLTFAVAASANFPALILALTWRRFTTLGAVLGVTFGLVSSLALIVLSPQVWAGPDSHDGAPVQLLNPAILSIPIGFLGCLIGTLLSREPEAERAFDELHVRSETGLGAEQAAAAGAEPALAGR